MNAPSDLPTGLSQSQAEERLRLDGYNELPAAKPRRVWAIAFDVVTEPMLLLLFTCGGIYVVLGDLQEALVLLGFVFVIIGISFFQEHKTERALEALRDLSSPPALVLRHGIQQRIAGREVVCGDILMLAEGDRVPADAILLSCLNMTVDESLLTGESLPVRKELITPAPSTMAQAGGDALPFVFSGSLVVQGKGLAQVMAIGSATEIGKIGAALFAVKEEPTRVQRETKQVVKVVAVASIVVAVLVAVWIGITRGDWLSASLVGITFAMAVIPEELPIVLSLFLGIGAWRIAQKRVLTRPVPAIEMLGAATVLCVDKTGTLTENKMQLTSLVADGVVFDCTTANALPEASHEVLEYAILASKRDPYDPMEIAIQECGQAKLISTEHLHQNWTLAEEYPLSKDLLAMSRVWTSPDQSSFIIAAKGAPEAIADLCHLPAEKTQALMVQVNQMASQGLRVLGVAKAQFAAPAKATTAESTEALPEIQHHFEFALLGLIALADPVRAGVPDAIRECQSAGIRVIMITGDYPATAASIAAQCGLNAEHQIMTGAELNELDERQLQTRLAKTSVFCRVVPEQKLRLVNALKSAGEIVAMTGDGVNDAPALKSAHIGIAMGKRGTDVARESASLVLLDDDFGSIVAAVKLGRRIFDNLRKTVAFIVAVHIPVIGVSLIPVLMGWPIVLMPIHILLLQLIIDPTCSLVFEAESSEEDVMQRPPRSTSASIFDRRIVRSGAIQGSFLLATIIGIYWFARHIGIDDDQSRALAFTSMVIGNIGLIFVQRSSSGDLVLALSRPNQMLWWVVAIGASMLVAALSFPSLNALFYFGHPEWKNLGASAVVAMVYVVLMLLMKRLSWKTDASIEQRKNTPSTT